MAFVNSALLAEKPKNIFLQIELLNSRYNIDQNSRLSANGVRNPFPEQSREERRAFLMQDFIIISESFSLFSILFPSRYTYTVDTELVHNVDETKEREEGEEKEA